MKRQLCTLQALLLSLIFAFGMLACNKKNDDPAPLAPSPVNPIGTYNGVCGSCNFSQYVLINAPSQAPMKSAILTFQWQVIGDANIAQQASFSGATSVAKAYYGPVMVTGTISVSSQTMAGFCVIPAGTYNIQTVQAGQMQNAIIYAPELIASGPIQFRFSIPGAVGIDSDGNGIIDRIGGPLQVLNVNGGAIPGGYSSCSDNVGVVLN